MMFDKITGWLDSLLEPGAFDDVSNNGLQIAREGEQVGKVAFAVDASLKSIEGAVRAGAQLLVVHHGISWGGGIRRLTQGEYKLVKAAMTGDLALYASHLPLDANREVGNNWELARLLGLKRIKRAFSYHGNIIGVTGYLDKAKEVTIGARTWTVPAGKIGVCSGGAGEFAPAAKFLECAAFLTGEANWGEVIAAENVGMPLILAGHYETETFGVRALARRLADELKLETVFIGREE
jgi:dinuclear metal center YbgI/SA1388 family protein